MSFVPILVPTGRASGRNQGYSEAFNKISRREEYAVGRFLANNEEFRRGVDEGIAQLRAAVGDVDKAVNISEIEPAGGKWRLSLSYTKASAEQAPPLREAAKDYVLSTFALGEGAVADSYYEYIGRSDDIAGQFEVGQALDYIGTLDDQAMYTLGLETAKSTILGGLEEYSSDEEHSWNWFEDELPDMSRYEHECVWTAFMDYAGKLLEKVQAGMKSAGTAQQAALAPV